MAFVPVIGKENVEALLADSTLVMPCVSVGNVAQLCVEALISTYNLEKIGYFDDPNVLPLAGNDALVEDESQAGNGQLNINMEVFHSAEKNLVIIQQRAPVIKRGRRDFVENVLSWYEKCRFRRLVLLSSCPAYQRTDVQMMGPQFRYFVSHPETPSANRCLQLQFPAFEQELFQDDPSVPSLLPSIQDIHLDEDRLEYIDDDEVNQFFGMSHLKRVVPSNPSPQPQFIRGGPVTRIFYELSQDKRIELIGLVAFSNEGENANDGLHLASVLNLFLFENPVEWKVPFSWQGALGSPHDPSLYL